MVVDPKKFLTTSLQRCPSGESIANILAAALDAVDPSKAVARYLRRDGDRLLVDQQVYQLDKIEHVYLVGAGKAGAPMARAAEAILSDCLTKGLAIVKDGYAGLEHELSVSAVEIVQAAHPLPDERGVEASRRIMEIVRKAGPDDLLICLISGGGSALLTSPASQISLVDMQDLTTQLLRRGAAIDEINTLRKHLDAVKGGGLARLAPQTQKIVMVLSDVIGDRLDVIASGPFCADPSTFQDAWRVLERFGMLETAPASILDLLRRGMRGEIPDTPKPGDPLFKLVQHVLVGSNLQAARAAQDVATRAGFHTVLLTTSLRGEARQAGLFFAELARQIDTSAYPAARPACLIAGGETTVTLTGNGLGGRNQEIALAAVPGLAGLPGTVLVTMATDGGDGPTDAAGAVATGDTLARAQAFHLDVQDSLNQNDSYHFFEKLGDLLKPGPTQTNVNDLAFVFAF